MTLEQLKQQDKKHAQKIADYLVNRCEEDKCLEDTVRRELKEETNLDLIKISKLPLIFEYESLGKTCVEHAFISYVKEDNIILNEESIDYKWCDIDKFIKLIKWYDNKDKLYKILNENIDNKNK